MPKQQHLGNTKDPIFINPFIMSRFLIVCLVLSNNYLHLTMADNGHWPVYANPPASDGIEQPPTAARKLGKHHHTILKSLAAPSLSPSEPPKTKENMPFSREVSSSGQENGTSQVEEIKISHHHHHHHSIDKSVAGGGVILGGLATAFLVAVFCYIRATGRKIVEPGSPIN
ncbi:unnamed protein product [Fraxinus pennsylvanica]|uniref:Uncharacterized protein n=1 Tax=Fraxinus pennsylvanica TaxID=56036 RepID=A0AAD2A5J9_9LAMI|nr:unnamed protein product [Fraxinus pennsylvanica]